MIEQTVREITDEARRLAEEGKLTPEAKHIAVAAQLQFIEYLDALLEGLDEGKIDFSITSSIEQIDLLAEHIAERMDK
jgi:hypothetical protein